MHEMKKYYQIVFLAVMFLHGASCKKAVPDQANNQDVKSTLAITLTDAPAAYTSVKVNITGIDYNISDDSAVTSGWIPLQMKTAGIFDLLSLQNGGSVNLLTNSIDTVSIKQLRLHFGANGNAVTDSGKVYQLSIPDEILQNGVAVKAAFTALANTTLSLWIDFDAAASVQHNLSNNTYTLFPVLRTFDPAATGSIEGYVTPPASAATIIVQNETGAAVPFTTRTYPDFTKSGQFKVMGLSPGNYIVTASPGVKGFIPTFFRNVNVQKNQLTSLGNINIRATSYQSSSLFTGNWKVFESVTRNIGGFVGTDSFEAKTIAQNDSSFGIVQTNRTPDPEWVLSYPYANADTLWFIPLQSNNILKNTYQGNIGTYSATRDTLQFTYTFGAPGNLFVFLVTQKWVKQ